MTEPPKGARAHFNPNVNYDITKKSPESPEKCQTPMLCYEHTYKRKGHYVHFTQPNESDERTLRCYITPLPYLQ